MTRPLSRFFLLLMLCCLPRPGAVRADAPASVTVARVDYQGWRDCVLLGNGAVEAVVVPAVGRVMQFRFAGAREGPFWENGALHGSRREPAAAEWSNFGGDKAWPAPQADWPRRIRRGWPPPGGFDGAAMEAVADTAGVTLISKVDPDYGIRVRRRIELLPGRPVMIITTRFEKVLGPAIEVAVWTIAQARDPAAVYALPPPGGPAGPAYACLSPALPPSLTVSGGLISLVRDPAANHKIGVRSGSLVWIGADAVLRLDADVAAGARYPDEGSSAEIYTEADPLPYVELEMLGPLATPEVGAAIVHRVTYTLARRTAPTPAAEIQRLLHP